MLFERIFTEGIAHYSYMVGDGVTAAVIDPRRDVDMYLSIAQNAGMRITYIFETHRNEDYLTGSEELASVSGAEIWHAEEQLDYRYGEPVYEGQMWQIGTLKIEAIHAPGHTQGMMNYILHDGKGAPWILFSGDTLFSGDIGRTDLFGTDHIEEMAGLLYDTLFEKILPLGDEVLLCPAHGSGSVCGGAISDRVLSTIGIERLHNPKLKYANKNAFIDAVGKPLEMPPYFKKMEELNLGGAPSVGRSFPKPLTAEEISFDMEHTVICDTRPIEAFASAHIPGSISLWPEGVASFAGWFLPLDTPLCLVTEKGAAYDTYRTLQRLGFDTIQGYLKGNLTSWLTSGYSTNEIKTITVHDFCSKLDTGEKPWILDVRSDSELETEGRISGAHHIHITQLPDHYDELPTDREMYLFCGSGKRSTIAASLLKKKKVYAPVVILGGFAGWNSISCPIKRE